LFEEGYAFKHGSNFKKKNLQRARSMIEASASSVFPWQSPIVVIKVGMVWRKTKRNPLTCMSRLNKKPMGTIGHSFCWVYVTITAGEPIKPHQSIRIVHQIKRTGQQ